MAKISAPCSVSIRGSLLDVYLVSLVLIVANLALGPIRGVVLRGAVGNFPDFSYTQLATDNGRDPMETRTKIFVATLLLAMSLPALAASAVQVWPCTFNDGKGQADVNAVSKGWLDAAKTMAGGEEIEVYVGYAVAGGSDPESFSFVLVANDMATWGKFWDGYAGSAAAEADEAFFEVATCGASSLESSVRIE